MTDEDFALLRPHLKLVSLDVQRVLVEPGQPVEHVYFLEHGIASVVAVSPSGERIEVANIGREGMAGHSIVQRVERTPLLTFIQVAGPASHLPASVLVRAMEESESLRALMLRYVQTTLIQMAFTSLANGRHTLSERLARWLLMSQDRLERDELPLTHEFLSLMLGVRRPGVTEAMHVLEGEHIIRAARGSITVLDRARLEEAAGDSYGVPEAEYERLIGKAAGRPKPDGASVTAERPQPS
jgi:CRP-like cAMP-binding protein